MPVRTGEGKMDETGDVGGRAGAHLSEARRPVKAEHGAIDEPGPERAASLAKALPLKIAGSIRLEEMLYAEIHL